MMISGRLAIVLASLAAITVASTIAINSNPKKGGSAREEEPIQQAFAYFWHPPAMSNLSTERIALINYGRELIASTSTYLGPTGKIKAITNGMNCQNCHLEAGTKHWGNNYSAVNANYPKFRERSGTVENIYKRINDCIERSLNGQKLDSGSRELESIAAYINWLGESVPRNIKPVTAGITELPLLDRAADTIKGRIVYQTTCVRCHGADGSGTLSPDRTKYVYPPLWGEHSYTTAAGLFRLSRIAGYVKDNMPFGAAHGKTELTNEEAWDVGAFINSQPRPVKHFKEDWPDIATKPFDHPFGPYADGFSESEHKYGPFGPIRAKQKTMKKKSKQ